MPSFFFNSSSSNTKHVISLRMLLLGLIDLFGSTTMYFNFGHITCYILEQLYYAVTPIKRSVGHFPDGDCLIEVRLYMYEGCHMTEGHYFKQFVYQMKIPVTYFQGKNTFLATLHTNCKQDQITSFLQFLPIKKNN